MQSTQLGPPCLSEKVPAAALVSQIISPSLGPLAHLQVPIREKDGRQLTSKKLTEDTKFSGESIIDPQAT